MRPLTWSLGVIVGLTVVACVVIWMLLGLARHTDHLRIPLREDSGPSQSPSDQTGMESTFTPLDEDHAPMWSDDGPFSSKTFPSTGETLASQRPFEIETGE